mgnify:CR=1 FL=1
MSEDGYPRRHVNPLTGEVRFALKIRGVVWDLKEKDLRELLRQAREAIGDKITIGHLAGVGRVQMSVADAAYIQQQLAENKVIHAIKRVREAANLSLADAKTVVDGLRHKGTYMNLLVSDSDEGD